MSTSLINLERLIARELGYLSGTATSGTTTTLVDTSADSELDVSDEEVKLESAWLKIESDSAGTPLNVGSVRRLKAEGGYTPTTQTVTWVTALTDAVTSTQGYGIYLGVPPGTSQGGQKGLTRYINEFLRTHQYRHYGLLTLITDGDMETSGVTNWTATNASASKITTATSVGKGKQALQVTTSATNGYVQSASVAVAGISRVMCCVADLAANTGTAKLQLWDVTNAAEIDSVSTTSRAVTTLWLNGANIPSTCHSVAVRLIGEGSGDVAVWDNVSLRPSGKMTIALPSWVTKRELVERVQESVDRGVTVTTDVLARDSRLFANVYDYEITEDYGAANQFRLTIPAVSFDRHAFVVGLRYYGELSADTDTTDADSDWVKAGVLVNIYVDKKQVKEAQRWAVERSTLDRSPRWSGRLWKPVGV